MRQRSMHYMCSQCPFISQRRAILQQHTKTHRSLKSTRQDVSRLEGKTDYSAFHSTSNMKAYSGKLRSASKSTVSVYYPTDAEIHSDSEATANRNTVSKTTTPEQQSVMKHDEKTDFVDAKRDSFLGNVWLQSINKCETSLEIALPCRDTVRSVYRPDIAEIWKVVDKLTSTTGGIKQCSLCPYKATTNMQCIEHVGTMHLGLKRWLCSLCDFCSDKKQNVIEHIQSEHPGKKCSAILCKNIYTSTYRRILENSAQNLQFRRLNDGEAYELAMHIKENTGQLSNVFQVCDGDASELSMLIIKLRPGQNGRYFAEDSFNCIFFDENVLIVNKIS